MQQIGFGEYLIKNLNKFITLVLTILFSMTFFLYQEFSFFTVYTVVALFTLNIFIFLTNGRLSRFFESLIYEVVALFGMYFISWYYILIFVLVADVVHYFRSKAVLITVIFSNAAVFIIMYNSVIEKDPTRIIELWHLLLLMLITIALSIYFVNSEEEYQTNDEYELYNTALNLEEKYNELLKEHKNLLFIKEIMDLSNNTVEVNDIVREINSMLLKNYSYVDFSTIFMFDENRNEFRIVTTNTPVSIHKFIVNIGQFDEFEDVINATHGKILTSSFGLMYPTAGERNIKSAFCIPLHTQKELIGLVLMESQSDNAFNDMDINKFNIVRYNISLIIENKLWVDKIRKMALVDGLTQVYNRNYLYEFLTNQMKWHKENNKKMYLVLYDIDHFKKFNDTYGHLFGDLVLKELSKLVKNSIRESDLIARYGGEEFIIVFTDTEKEAARLRTDEIRIKIQNSTVRSEEGVEAKVTVSFGVAEFGKNSYNIVIKDLIERADQALYKSKENGRNRVTVFEENEEGL